MCFCWFPTMGMTLVAAAADLIMLFLAIETVSIPLYVLSGFMVHDDRSTEAGFKYLLFGAMTTAVMLYGLTLLFGFSGAAGLAEIGRGHRRRRNSHAGSGWGLSSGAGRLWLQSLDGPAAFLGSRRL